ncbi:topoisomerase DNA-binding C4 zinc finger domain-containing protein [Bacillus cereus]|nr:topoisomerase DNA-binding C4 zinc finger domain-containing protein [Bacillus cereus]
MIRQLVVRNGKNGPFLGCCEFPTCKHTENLMK